MSGELYRFVMRVAHKYNWHYAPPIYPEGDTVLWCHWCGFRDTIKRANRPKNTENTPNCNIPKSEELRGG